MDFRLVPRGTDRNYTGFFTKTIVYSGTLVVFLACKFRGRACEVGRWVICILTRHPRTTAFALTLCSIIIPKWVSYHSDQVRRPPSNRSPSEKGSLTSTDQLYSQPTTTPTASTAAALPSRIPARASPSATTAMATTGISARCGDPSAS